MATKKDNLKALFSNSRTRLVIVSTLVLLAFMVIVGVSRFYLSTAGESGGSNFGRGPGSIESIPGGADPTAQYAKLVQEQNLKQAETAKQSGGSAIPTIIKTQSISPGVGVIGESQGVGFESLAQSEIEGPQQQMWLKELQDQQCSKSIVDQVLAEGAKLKDVKQKCSCLILKDVGIPLKDLRTVCSCKELKASGFDATALKNDGFSATELVACGYSTCELKASGYTAADLKAAGFTDGELKGAGFSASDILSAGGIPAGMTADDIRKAGCSVDALKKLKAQGVSAAAIRKISGCSLDALKSAGFDVSALKEAGYTDAELKKAGFSAKELKDAGASLDSLKQLGFSNADLLNAGFSSGELSALKGIPPGTTLADIAKAACNIEELKKLRAKGVSAAAIRDANHCSLADLKAAGFTAEELKAAGFSDDELLAAGFSAAEIKAIPLDTNQYNCTIDSLKAQRAKGISAETIRKTLGCSPDALKAAGFNAKELKDAGLSAAELLTAGFNSDDLKNAQFSAAELMAAGMSAADLKKMGFSAAVLKEAGFSAADLKKAGYSAADLKKAGFNARELKNAGFSIQDLKSAGFTAKELKDAGTSAALLKQAGFSVQDLKAAGFSDKTIAGLGYDRNELENAGIDVNLIPGLNLPNASQNAVAGGGEVGTSTPTNLQNQANQLQNILERQNKQFEAQQYQQQIQQRASQMQASASQFLSTLGQTNGQTYVAGMETDDKNAPGAAGANQGAAQAINGLNPQGAQNAGGPNQAPLIKAGDILFAVIDTSVNSDEPGPILATIVSGKLKGSRVMGSFNLPQNAQKMVLTFNVLSVPGAPKTTSINAYAIDPDTARTALSSRTDNHYLLRYGSLFASTFITGFGNAFQSANTTITIGGTGGVQNTTVSNGVGRSTLQNAVIALASVGKAWGQYAKQNMTRPTTVEINSGTSVGLLFTQDLASIS